MAAAPQHAADVLIAEHAAPGGRAVAEITLNVEATLNSLSLGMAHTIAAALRGWRNDGRIACVLIRGAGDRAFCAGGDIQALYAAMVKNHAAGRVVDDYPFQFFEHEYRLDYLIHNYPKPVVALGHGVVMGGGLGIYSASRFRLVTEGSRIACPEVTIGLFPDAGATWLLRNLNPAVALFLGCTGSHVNCADALAAGIATHSVAGASRPGVLAALNAVDYSGDASDFDRVDDALSALPGPELPETQLGAVPDSLSLEGGYADVADRIGGLADASRWVDKGIATMRRGCPTSVGILIEQLRRAPGLDLADCFRLEMTVGTHCAHNGDFAEGVRALIIEKDNRPRWRYGDLDGLDAAHVLGHFEAPWPRNPLHDLENDG
ncbi:MAG: enoyl-CoA hydratase/isomerase family protein [Gammaproteobacteria bacterium]|nr:enoyl-CoA hydratase/isomerase family protein [Gammaproteobacteria bacterium]